MLMSLILVTIAMCKIKIMSQSWDSDEGTDPTVKSLLASNLVHKVDPDEV